jgi:hypothetical protein
VSAAMGSTGGCDADDDGSHTSLNYATLVLMCCAARTVVCWVHAVHARRTASSALGDIFVQLGPRFALFGDYCQQVETAMTTVVRCQHEYPWFGRCVAQLQLTPCTTAVGGDGSSSSPSSSPLLPRDLHSYLITPVQRMPR